MRSKLSLTICLAAFAACVVAGTAVGQDEVVGSGEGAVEIDLPDGEQLEDLESLPECSNLVDDDADQLVDLGDPECTSPLDTSESESAPPPAEPAEPPAPPAPPAEPGEPTIPEIPGGETFHPDAGVSGPRGSDGRGGGHKPD